LWRLDGTTWIPVLKLSTSTTAKADVKPAGTPAGSVVHVLLYNGTSADLASLQYNSGSSTYEAWSIRPGLTSLSLPGSETVTIDIDSTGRMWLATQYNASSNRNMIVYYGDSPYSSWSSSITLATVTNIQDDISLVTAQPNNTIGVLWSNQATKRFGYRYHKDTDLATTWSTEELPTSQYGYNVGVSGFADDHLNVAVASDGTLYAAIKTGYDTAGYPKIAMMVRRLSGDPGAGVWDANIYGVSESGTRGIVVLDQAAGVVTVIYTSSESGGNILYQQTAVQPIAFKTVKTMRSGTNNDASSTKQNINGELVTIYSSGTTINGSLCSVANTLPPSIPTSPDPADGAVGFPVDPNNNDAVALQATVNDADSNNLTVSFYGRPSCDALNFTLAVLPDTQLYSKNTGGFLQIFDDQTQWIADNKADRNIVYTTHLGDVVDTNDTTQWANANEAITRLETGSVAYGLSLGNHDGAPDTTGNFNSVFPYTRFAGRPYYGGQYGANNDNSFGLFSSGGLDFIIIQLEWNPSPDTAVLAWADNLLANLYQSRRGIVIFHDLVQSTTALSPSGQIVYDYLKHNANLFLMLGGHADTEIKLTLTDSGHTIYALRSDYQTRPNGGNGWLRLMEFRPTANQIQVYTYSPYLNQSETDADSQFTLVYAMGGAGCEQFALVQTLTGVSSGMSPIVKWYDRSGNTPYEWYVTVSDGTYTVTGPIWSFTTDSPTAVRLVDFSATSLPQGIQLSWLSALEIDLLGFNLLRAEFPEGSQITVNADLITAVNPGQQQGNNYLYLDSSAEVGKTYYYWVEWVGNRDSELFGPVVNSLVPYHVWLPIGLNR
jgi:hypothetical protein